jgi:hypothetical protein
MYKNGKMRPVGTILRMGGGDIREIMVGVNFTKTYCKCFGKYHKVPPV